MSKSIAIIETSAVSSAELKALCREMMPEVTVYEIIDSSLIEEVKANGGPTKAVRSRMFKYYEIAAGLGVDAILNQCSSVSEVAEEAKKLIDVPIVKVDEAMARKAVSMGEKIAVVATVASTLPPSCRLVESMAAEAGKEIDLREYLVDGAMALLIATGDVEKHNAMVIGTIEKAAVENDVVVLAQGSMTVIEPLLKGIEKPVLTSPRVGVEYLKKVVYNEK